MRYVVVKSGFCQTSSWFIGSINRTSNDSNGPNKSTQGWIKITGWDNSRSLEFTLFYAKRGQHIHIIIFIRVLYRCCRWNEMRVPPTHRCWAISPVLWSLVPEVPGLFLFKGNSFRYNTDIGVDCSRCLPFSRQRPCPRVYSIQVDSPLVGGLEPWNFTTFHSVGNFMIPTDFHSIISQKGWLKPPTSILTSNHHKSPLITINHHKSPELTPEVNFFIGRQFFFQRPSAILDMAKWAWMEVQWTFAL